jgi:hypothetical protein
MDEMKDEAERLKALEDNVFTDQGVEEPDDKQIRQMLSVKLRSSDEEIDLTDEIYETSHGLMKTTMEGHRSVRNVLQRPWGS